MSTLGFGIRSLVFIIHPEVHGEFQAGNFVIRKTYPTYHLACQLTKHMNKTIAWLKDHDMQSVLQKVVVHSHVGW